MAYKKRDKIVPINKINLHLCTRKLPGGVMVALRILVPPVRVRILPGQQFSVKRPYISKITVFFTY